MRIEKVAEGAYFVPSYTEQPIVSYLPGMTGQTIVTDMNMDKVESAAHDGSLPFLQPESEGAEQA